ncbi:nucleotide disphospho-sugar-binding domain-containing protein [Streptomyces sp. NPDC055189]
MRVLILSSPIPTHCTPMLPLAWALQGAGHTVLVAGQPDVLDAVCGAGVSAVSVGDRFDVLGMLAAGLGEEERPLQARPRPARTSWGGYGQVWWANAGKHLDEVLEFARGFGPDLIVADPLEYTSLFAGAVLDVPVVHHRWGVDAFSGPALEFVREPLREEGERRGIEVLERPTAMLDPCPPALQNPDAEPGIPMRYVPSNGSGVLPGWLRADAAKGRTRGLRVAVSFGTQILALNGVPFTRRVLRAFEDFPGVEVVATIPAEYRAAIGPVPGNVRMVDPVPLRLFLDTCRAVIHQGGAGTSMTANAFGLPQLALPQLADGFEHGDRLAAVGAGITIDDAAEQDSPERLRTALTVLLQDTGMATRARELARAIEAAPSPADVVAHLEALTRQDPTERSRTPTEE